MDDYNTTYNLPDELVSDPKIFKYLPIRTLLLIVLFVFIGLSLQEKVYTPLQMPFVIYNGIVGFVLSLPSPVKIQKKLYDTILITLFSDKRYYEPIPNPEKMPTTIRQYERYEGSVKFVEPE